MHQLQIQSFVYSIFADVPRSTLSHERWETKNSIFPRFIYIYFFVSSSSCQLHRVIFKIFRRNSTVVKIRKIRIVDKANKNRGLQRSRTILRSESPPHPFSFLSPRCLCLPLPCSSFPRIQSNVATLPDKSRSKKRRNALTGSKRLSVFLRHFRCDSLSLSLSSALRPSSFIGSVIRRLIYYLFTTSPTNLWSIFIKLKLNSKTAETDFRHLGRRGEEDFMRL